MKNLSKNRKNLSNNIDLTKTYGANEAIKILKDNSFVKFEETLDVAIQLNINPSKTDQILTKAIKSKQNRSNPNEINQIRTKSIKCNQNQ